VVAAMDHSAAAGRQQVADAGDVQRAGTYVLRGVASDGSLFTYENVTVIVAR
jgi:hypothetical protein